MGTYLWFFVAHKLGQDDIFSSPEPLGSQGELIGWLSSVRRPQFSEGTWPIKVKFYRKTL